MSALRCVVFDIDDTLYLERDYVRSGFEAVGRWAAAALGISGVGAAALTEFEQGRRGDIFDRVLRAAGVVPEPAVVGEMVECYRSHAPSITLLPDARTCLATLSGRFALAGVTDGPASSQRAKAEALDLRAWLDPIVFTSELGEGRGKPDPAAFRLVEARWEVRGAACAYVADNPAKDFQGPHRLGWRTIRVRRPGGLHCAAPSAADVNVEIASLNELIDLLGVAP